ncbi:hypothetical protein MesoLjLc_51480 [Mesorhizobium sp. L-8-10]|nr:hypothetical protein MesoLjLc_51480 [Mesorhizobium sp. L-8-10]
MAERGDLAVRSPAPNQTKTKAPFSRPVRSNLFPVPPPLPLRVKKLITMIGVWHGVTYEEIVGESRSRKVVEARFDAMAEVKLHRPDWSLPRIGEVFNKDHTCVLNAVKQRRKFNAAD